MLQQGTEQPAVQPPSPSRAAAGESRARAQAPSGGRSSKIAASASAASPEDRLATMLQRAVARRVLARAAGPLTPEQEQAAITAAKARFSNIAIRALQLSVRTTSDGDFGPESAQAVAGFQQALVSGHAVDGIVDEPTLDTVVASNAAGAINSATLSIVSSFYGLDLGDVLSLLARKEAGPSTMKVESGGLRVIKIGRDVFTSAAGVRDAIQAQLDDPLIPSGAPTAAPSVLSSGKASSAIAFNATRLRDPRSVIAIQHRFGNPLTGTWDADTVQRVAGFQQNNDETTLDVDGKVGPKTLRAIAITMLEPKDTADIQHNSLLRMIVDFYKLDETDLIDISHDPTMEGDNAKTDNMVDGPSKVRIGPNAFTQTFEELVHTVAHELEHVRQTRVGVAGKNVREFLGERIEILSKGMMEEDFVGFADDIDRALGLFKAMTKAEQRKQWTHLEQVRTKVRARFAAASKDERDPYAHLLKGYNALAKP